MRRFQTLAAAFVGLVFLLSPLQSAMAGFHKWVPPDIKTAFCGTRIDFRYCKCAFHGQYCDDIGYSSADANGIVQTQYADWVRVTLADWLKNCNDDYAFWDSQRDGCMRCDPPAFAYKKQKCATVEELCSSDPKVKFDKEKDACFCPFDHELLADKTCDPICGTDPKIHYDAEKNTCDCEVGYEAEEDSEAKYVCKSVCGDDPTFVYNAEKEECGCVQGYELKTVDGKESCVEKPEVELWVTFSDPKPPFMADGKTKAVIDVEIFDPASGKGVPARFEVGYTNASAKGALVSTEELEPGKYRLAYQTADLSGGPAGVFEDQLYVFYKSKKEKKEVYKTKPIQVAVGKMVDVRISKAGFKEQILPVVFTAPRAELVVSVESKGKAVPVAEAEALMPDGYTSFKSNAEGTIWVEAPETIESDIATELKVFLELDEVTADDLADAKKNYDKLVTSVTDKKYPGIDEFTGNFIEKLAKADGDGEAEKMVSGLKRTKYALFYLIQGDEMLGATTKGVADSLKDQIWDLVDTANIIGKATSFLAGPIKNFLKGGAEMVEGVGGYFGKEAMKGVEKWGAEWGEHFATTEAEAAKKELSQLSESLGGWSESFMKKIGSMITSATAAKAPNFKQGWMTEFTGAMATKYIQDRQVKEGYNKVAYENWIQDFFKKKYKSQIDQLASGIEKRVKSGDWDAVHEDSDLLLAKWDYDDIMSRYRLAASTDVSMTEHKANIELVLDFVLTPAKFAVATKAAAEAVELAYKGARSMVLNNQVLYEWFDATGVVVEKMRTGVLKSLGSSDLSYRPSIGFFPIAYAQEAAPGTEGGEAFIEYTEADTELGLLSELDKTLSLVQKQFPDETGEVEKYQEHLAESIESARATKESLKETVAPFLNEEKAGVEAEGGCFNKNDTNCDGKVDLKDFTMAEWGVIGLFLLVGLAILRFAVKGFRRLFSKGKKSKR